jgi:hypothetical protein
MASKDKGFTPPYNLPFATFITTLDKVGADQPDKLDRSYLGSASGSLKSYVISAFRGFGLIDDEHNVSSELTALATDPSQRAERIRELVRHHYPKAVVLGTTNATSGQLDSAFAEMFPSVTGESRTKAIRFFLSACDFAGIPKSPLWKSPKAQSGPRKPKSRKPAIHTAHSEVTQPQKAGPSQSLRDFTLPSGRVMTISIDGDVLALERDERKFVMGIIDEIEEHIEAHRPATTSRTSRAKAKVMVQSNGEAEETA